MQINLHDTIATMNRMEVANDSVVVGVGLALIIDGSTLSTGVQVAVNRIFRCGPNGEAQREDGINLVVTGCPNRIHIRTTGPDVLATPDNGVAFTSGQLSCVLVGLRGSRNDSNLQFVDAVTTAGGRLYIAINAIREDVKSVPVEYFALRQIA